jgi:alkylation response protein AidB-like acyl-CoA dehydrogenase
MEDMFITNDNQRAILETVRRFSEDVVVPVAAQLDAEKDPLNTFSWDIVEKSHDVGIRTMSLDEKWGGLAADCVTCAMVVEELGKADLGISVVMAQTLKIAQIMQRALNEEQQARVMPQIAEDKRCVLAIGITEPENASNYIIPYPTQFKTYAEKVPGGWKVNGMKHFISNGPRARYYLLFVQTDRSKPQTEGTTCFLVERGHPGFTIGRYHDKMGERLANNAELIFQDCFIPDENVVGDVNKAYKLIVDFFPMSNAYAGASILGVAGALYQKSVDWCSIRVQGGKPLIQHDGIRAQLAEMRMMIDVARSYIHRSCWLSDHRDQGWDSTLAVYPKVFASQIAWKIAGWALELHGGTGYMKETGLEKLVRDAAAFLHSDGVNRTLLLKAANLLYK